MFHIHSVAGRIAIGIMIGLLVGLLYTLLMPSLDLPMFSMFSFGTVLMFGLMGITTGFIGLFDRHPVFAFKMNWWIRGVIVGCAFMLMYVLLTFDVYEGIMRSSLISWSGLTSPFWIVLDGIAVGLVMSFFETQLAGEGKKLPVM
jgi:hypothetical protein